MGKRIRDYVKYTKKELENYVDSKNSCVKRINRKIHLNLPPHGIGINFKKTLMYIISEKKIGSYDQELNGIILDIRNIKVLGQTGAIRFDDPIIHLDIQADCYAFQPQIGSIVHGIVKHISSRQIGVIIYRVFSVSIRLQDQNDLESIELNSEIEFRIKNFDLKNMMPYIEGELVAKEMPLLGSNSNHIYMNVNDSDDSSSSEDENENHSSSKKLLRKAMFEEIEEKPKEVFKVPKTPKRKSILSKYQHLTDDNDDEEIIFSKIFHLNQDEVKELEKKKNKKNETKMLNDETNEIEESKKQVSNKKSTKIKIKIPNLSNSPKKKKKMVTSDDAEREISPKKQRGNAIDISNKNGVIETEKITNNVKNSPIKTEIDILNNSTSLESSASPVKRSKKNSYSSNEKTGINFQITQLQRSPIKIEDIESNGYESTDLFENLSSQSPFKLSGSEMNIHSTIKKENRRNRTISAEIKDEIVEILNEIKQSPNKKSEKIEKIEFPTILNGASKEDIESTRKFIKNKKYHNEGKEFENSEFDSESMSSAKTSGKTFKKIKDSNGLSDYVPEIIAKSKKRKTSEKYSDTAKKIKT